jgi:hypothetical protein
MDLRKKLEEAADLLDAHLAAHGCGFILAVFTIPSLDEPTIAVESVSSHIAPVDAAGVCEVMANQLRGMPQPDWVIPMERNGEEDE